IAIVITAQISQIVKQNTHHQQQLAIAMAMTTRTLLLAAVCAAAALPRGWSPIKNIDDPHIQELGRWAITENNRVSPSDELTFHRVTGGEQQVVSGMNYRLEIEAASGGGDVTGSYGAVVFEQEWSNTRKLISFDKNHNF
ncbi:Os03g0210200, partial [Oryza sativa Japonica Group]